MVAPRFLTHMLDFLILMTFVATVTADDHKVDVTKVEGHSQGLMTFENNVTNTVGLVDADDVDECGLDPDSKIEGIHFKDLTIGEIYKIADDRDEIVKFEWDTVAYERQALERSNYRSRKKRWLAQGMRHLWSAGRGLFKGSKPGRITSSGNRVTRQYDKPGNYEDAIRDFDRFKPDNRKTFDNGKISGQSGTFGDHKLTVRDGSKNEGPPTLDVRSPRPDGSSYTRKFRYSGNE